MTETPAIPNIRKIPATMYLASNSLFFACLNAKVEPTIAKNQTMNPDMMGEAACIQG